MKSYVLLIGLFVVVSGKTISDGWPNVRHKENISPYGDQRNTTPSRRISNGQEATPGQFPYQVFLNTKYESKTRTYNTGGSILTQNYILTAAFSVFSQGEFTSGGTAIVGAHDLTIVEASQQRIRFSPNGIVVHPQYTDTNQRNNIALVRLDSPITFNDRVQPVRLPARSDTRNFAGLMGTVSGHGFITADIPSDDVLRFTTNPVMANNDCTAIHNSSIVQPQDVCLTGEGGRGLCPGNIGGPLTIQDNGSLQIGIAGRAFTCENGTPSLYVRVSFFLGFIEANSDYVARP